MSVRCKFVLLFSFALYCVGCAGTFDDLRIRNQESNIYVGMTYNEVVTIVGREANTIVDTVQRGVDADGEWMIWIVGVTRGFGNSNFSSTYTFKFRNGKLIEWWKS